MIKETHISIHVHVSRTATQRERQRDKERERETEFAGSMIVLCGCALRPRGERWLHLVRHLRQDGYIVYHPKSSVRKSEWVSLFGKAIDLGYIAIIIFFLSWPYVLLCCWVLVGEHSRLRGQRGWTESAQSSNVWSHKSHLLKVDQTTNKRLIANVQEIGVLGDQGHERNDWGDKFGLECSKNFVISRGVL